MVFERVIPNGPVWVGFRPVTKASVKVERVVLISSSRQGKVGLQLKAVTSFGMRLVGRIVTFGNRHHTTDGGCKTYEGWNVRVDCLGGLLRGSVSERKLISLDNEMHRFARYRAKHTEQGSG